eukprot:gene6555-8865_t
MAVILDTRLAPLYADYISAINAMADYNTRLGKTSAQATDAAVASGKVLILVCFFVALLVGLAIAFAIIRSLNRTLQRVSTTLAEGSAQVTSAAAEIDDSVTTSHHAAAVCAHVANHLHEITAKAREVDDLIAEIASASTEQTQGIAQVNTAIGEMDRVVQAGAARAEEGAGVAQELTTGSEQLQATVDALAAVVGGQSVPAPA